jgi:LmbE family N-acetylglucosaminyl deacetylase
MCLIIVLLSLTGIEKTEASNPNKNNHVVFYIPHQDDEALTFGVSILNHIEKGYNVHIVLLTDGAASFVRKKLGMSKEDFTAARNKEFALSLKNMGVKPGNIEYMNYKDSELTVKNVECVIKKYEAKYPNARHKVFSWTDKDNHDHSNSGIALKNLQKKNIVSDARYYVRRGDNPKGLRLINEYYSTEYKKPLLAVSASYKENSKLGLRGIGHKSVKKSFVSFEKQPISRYHK